MGSGLSSMGRSLDALVGGENVNRQPKAKLDDQKRHLLPVPMASPVNYPLSQ